MKPATRREGADGGRSVALAPTQLAGSGSLPRSPTVHRTAPLAADLGERRRSAVPVGGAAALVVIAGIYGASRFVGDGGASTTVALEPSASASAAVAAVDASDDGSPRAGGYESDAQVLVESDAFAAPEDAAAGDGEAD